MVNYEESLTSNDSEQHMRATSPSFRVIWIILLLILIQACGVKIRESKIDSIPKEHISKITIGATKERVEAKLGEPTLYSTSHAVAVYKTTGYDLYLLLFTPIPYPQKATTALTLVKYDESNIVVDVNSVVYDKQEQLANDDIWITAGDFVYTNILPEFEPEILLGPSRSTQSLIAGSSDGNKCTVIFIMGKCPMDVIRLNDNKVSDLSPAGIFCHVWTEQIRHNLYNTYISKTVDPGPVELSIYHNATQGITALSRLKKLKHEIDTQFNCESGEVAYIELDVQQLFNEYGEFSGVTAELIINKKIPDSISKMEELRPILWDGEKWVQ